LNIPKTINIKGTLVDLSEPKVMGILNVTPDSFFSGSRKMILGDILKSAEQMIEAGATFIDIGGYSSRPGAVDVSIEEELRRVIEPIAEISKAFPELYISIDTFRSEVAKAACDHGAVIVNDISGGDLDEKMFSVVSKLKLPYIAMHMRGTPQNMIEKTDYVDVTKEVVKSLAQKVNALYKAGVKDVIIDPGFGFAKNREHNFQLLNQMDYLATLNLPILVGLSRKAMIYKTLNTDATQALNGTTVLNTVALLKGASILRVHDVKEAMEAIQLIKHLKN
jgi:dihydropteroate synthase